jgi:hypothetical protein
MHIALENGLAQCSISLDKNCIVLNQLTKVWSHTAFKKETVYQKIVHRGISLHNTGTVPTKKSKRGESPFEKFWSSAMERSAGQTFAIDYLGEYESEIENILGC